MGKRQTNNTSKKLLLHNTSTINSTPTKHQSASVSTSDKNPLTTQKSKSPNQQTATLNNPDSKRLKIFTEIYTPTKHKTNLMGRQTASINNLKDTEPSIPHTIHNTTHFPYKLKVKQRHETLKNNKKANLPNKPKQQKMTGFGFNCAQKVHDSQKDIFTTNGNTIRATLHSTQESQRNDYFGDKLTTKPTEHLRIISLNINGLDLGKGEHSLLQLCLNLQDKGVDILCLTETNVNWQHHHLVQRFSTTLKTAWPKQKISLCTSNSSLPWNSNYKPGGTAIIALGNISSAIITKG